MHDTKSGTDLIIVLLSGAVGAVLGALIPILIQPYIGHRQKLYKRRLRYINRLVVLELNLLDIDSCLHDNIIAIKAIQNALKASRMTSQRPFVISLDDTVFTDVLSKDLNNKLYSLRYDLIRLKKDITSFNDIYDLLNNSLLVQAVEADYYEKQMAGLTVEAPILVRHMERIQKDAVHALAYTRARREKDTTWLMKHRSKILENGLGEVTPEDVDKQEEQHYKDIASNH